MLESVIVNCSIDSLFVRIIINERTDAWHRQVVTVGNWSHKRVKGFVSVLGSDGPFYPFIVVFLSVVCYYKQKFVNGVLVEADDPNAKNRQVDACGSI